MCRLCEREDRLLKAIDTGLETQLVIEKENGEDVTPFVPAQALARQAIDTLMVVPNRKKETDLPMFERSLQESKLVGEHILEEMNKLSAAQPGGLMQGNVIIGVLQAAYSMLSEFNREYEIQKDLSGNPLLSILSELGLFAEGLEGKEAINTDSVNNVTDTTAFSSLLGAIQDKS